MHTTPNASRGRPPTVSLFIQCLVDAWCPEVGDAMVRIFDRLNIPLAYPQGQTCCGQPAYNSGYLREARAAAKHFLDLFAAAEVIVCPSGSCVAMVRYHYPELFRNDPDRHKQALAVGAKTFELSEFLVDILGITDLGAVFPARVTYHDSCHLARVLSIREQPRRLLEKVSGLQLVEMTTADACCGFGGAFSVGYPDISLAMVDEKIAAILASGAETVVGCDLGCLMNIRSRLSHKNLTIRTLHIAEVLAGSRDS
jgi:L-lactate dehydrogenase complex protein LldE